MEIVVYRLPIRNYEFLAQNNTARLTMEDNSWRIVRVINPNAEQINQFNWKQGLRPESVWEICKKLFIHNYYQIEERSERLDNGVPFIALNSTGHQNLDDQLLTTLAETTLQNADRELSDRKSAFKIAKGEAEDRIAIEERSFYNLALMPQIAVQRQRLSDLRRITVPEIISQVEDYEVSSLQPIEEVIRHVGIYAIRHLTPAQANVFPIDRPLDDLKELSECCQLDPERRAAVEARIAQIKAAKPTQTADRRMIYLTGPHATF